MKNYMPLTDEDERECIRKVQAGDRKSFRSLVDKYKDMLKGYCIGKLGCPFESAEEVAWEVFGQAWRNIATFKYDSKFSTWLCAIAHNHYLNKCKSCNNPAEEFIDAEDHSKGRFADSIATQDCVKRQLGKIRIEHRDVIDFVHLQDMSYKDAAQKLNWTLERVRKRLNVALKEAGPFLKECL